MVLVDRDVTPDEIREVVALWLPPGDCAVFREGAAFVVVWSSGDRDLRFTREGRSDLSFDEAVHRLIDAAAPIILLWRENRYGSPGGCPPRRTPAASSRNDIPDQDGRRIDLEQATQDTNEVVYDVPPRTLRT